jgi:transcription antitermination factor NusG
MTKRGRVRSTEPLFINYIFARFVLEALLERVRYTPSVKGIVAFGERPAVIAPAVIEELRCTLAANSDTVFTDLPVEGDEAEILEGPFSGQSVTIARVLPARQRVEALMEVLGRSVSVEFSLSSLLFRHRTLGQSVLGLPRSEPMLAPA